MASKLSIDVKLSIVGGWCDTGSARLVEAMVGAAEPGFDLVKTRAVTSGVLDLGPYALAAVECDAAPRVEATEQYV